MSSSLHNAAGERWCATCRAYVAVELFHRRRGAALDGLSRECRVCHRQRGRVAYRAHPEQRARAISRALAWQAAHPERAREIHRQAQRVYAVGQQLLASIHAPQHEPQHEPQREEQAGC